MVHHIKDIEDFEAKLAEASSNLVVVDFFAVWCGPCKIIGPKMEEMAGEFPNVIFLKVDVDECENIAEHYNISAMPTFLFIKGKDEVDRFSGANAEKLKEYIEKLK